MSRRSDRPEHQSSRLVSTELDARRETLEDRLSEGFERIDQALASGVDVGEWESFWIRLLAEYEGVCRELDQAA